MSTNFYKNKILGNLKNFTSSEKKVVDFLSNNNVTMSIKELEKSTGVSTSTISQLVKKLGYENFKEFMSDQREVNNNKKNLDILKTDVVSKILNSYKLQIMAIINHSLGIKLKNT